MDDTSLLTQHCFTVICCSHYLQMHLCSPLYLLIRLQGPAKSVRPSGGFPAGYFPQFWNPDVEIQEDTHTCTQTHTQTPLSLCSTCSPSLYLTFLSACYVHPIHLQTGSQTLPLLYLHESHAHTPHAHSHTVIHTSTKKI